MAKLILAFCFALLTLLPFSEGTEYEIVNEGVDSIIDHLKQGLQLEEQFGTIKVEPLTTSGLLVWGITHGVLKGLSNIQRIRNATAYFDENDMKYYVHVTLSTGEVQLKGTYWYHLLFTSGKGELTALTDQVLISMNLVVTPEGEGKLKDIAVSFPADIVVVDSTILHYVGGLTSTMKNFLRSSVRHIMTTKFFDFVNKSLENFPISLL